MEEKKDNTFAKKKPPYLILIEPCATESGIYFHVHVLNIFRITKNIIPQGT